MRGTYLSNEGSMKISLREVFAWVTVACLIGTIYYQDGRIRAERAQAIEWEKQYLSVKHIAAHHGVDIQSNGKVVVRPSANAIENILSSP